MILLSTFAVMALNPQPTELHVGLSPGVTLFSKHHDLFDEKARINGGHRSFLIPTPSIGTFALLKFHPYLRAEATGRLAFAQDVNARHALSWSADAGVSGLLPIYDQMRHWSFVGYAGAGLGLWGVASSRIVVGNDVDFVGYLSAGVSFSWHRWMMQLEGRDYISSSVRRTFSHNGVFVLGFGMRIFPWNQRNQENIFD